MSLSTFIVNSDSPLRHREGAQRLRRSTCKALKRLKHIWIAASKLKFLLAMTILGKIHYIYRHREDTGPSVVIKGRFDQTKKGPQKGPRY